jgi:hypothetical protein
MNLAIRAAKRQSRRGPRFDVGMCLQRVRLCYGIAALYPTAAAAWAGAKSKHRTTNPADAPRGATLFWTGGSAGAGHVAIATGYRGRCWSTDIRRPGYFDKVPADEIAERWGMTFVGWTEELNGVRLPITHRRRIGRR